MTQIALEPAYAGRPQGPRSPEPGLRQVLEGMSLALDPGAAGDLRATIQFMVTGPAPAAYYLQIGGGACRFEPGQAGAPTLVITTPEEVWVAIARGRLDAGEAAMRGLYRATGDLSLLLRLGTLFKPAASVEVRAQPRRRPAGPLSLTGPQWMTLAFVPTTLFWILSSLPGSSPWLRVGLPLALSLALWGYRLACNRPTWLEGGQCLLLAGLAVLTLVGGPAALRWGAAFVALGQGCIWLSSLLFGDLPVTASYVQWDYVPALARLSLFIHPNAVLTLVWGWQFLAAGGLGLAAGWLPAWRLPLLAAGYLLIVPAALFTRHYRRGVGQRRIPDFGRAMARLRLAATAGLGLAACALVWVCR